MQEKHKTFDEFLNDEELVSEALREEVNFEAALIGKIIEARKTQGISQRRLAELSGIKQPAIARLERGKSAPQIDTLLKLLVPLGYTLEIVPLKGRAYR